MTMAGQEPCELGTTSQRQVRTSAVMVHPDLAGGEEAEQLTYAGGWGSAALRRSVSSPT